VATPIQVPNLVKIKELATGVNHLLALAHDGAVWSCGSGHQAELGRRIIPRRPYAALEPRIVLPAKHRIDRIFAGFNHNFAIDRRGQVYSWGLNNFGQTGHGVDDSILHIVTPSIVKSLQDKGIVEIAAGFHHSLARTEQGTLLAWGRCDDGQLGVDLDGVQTVVDSRGRPKVVPVPVQVKGKFVLYESLSVRF
jgi:regulator of chromosome condensation